MTCIMTEYNFVENEVLIHSTVITCLGVLFYVCTAHLMLNTVLPIFRSIAFRYLQPSATWRCNTRTIWPFERGRQAVSKLCFLFGKCVGCFPVVPIIIYLFSSPSSSCAVSCDLSRMNTLLQKRKKTAVITRKKVSQNICRNQ